MNARPPRKSGGFMTQVAHAGKYSSPYLDLRALAPLRHMRFSTHHRIEGAFSGRHRSSQQGGAGEFMDYREYSEGEDLRRLDWKVLARSDRAYVRLYVDETNLRCTLAMDFSASMNFNGKPQRRGRPDFSESKMEYARYLGTAISQIIGSQQDQIGLAVLAGGLVEHLPPSSTPTHLTILQQKIAETQAAPQTNLSQGLHTLFTQLTRRGVLVLMADFLVDDLDGLFSTIRLYRHRQWEVVLIHVVHPAEERLTAGPAYRFEGLENEGQINCSPSQIAREYEERFEAHCANVRALSLACGCDYRRVSTATPYLETLRTFLVERTA